MLEALTAAPEAAISLDPSAWAPAVAADFRRAFPVDRISALIAGGLKAVRAKTAHNARYSVAIFQGTIAANFPHRLSSPMRDQVDMETLRCFSAHLARTNGPRSVADHLSRLIFVLKRLRLDEHVFLVEIERARRKLPPRSKRTPPFTTKKLWEAGESLMAKAKARFNRRSAGRAHPAFLRATGELYRDGLILCFSALCLPRISNTSSMRIGQHLLRSGRVYRFHFPAHEVKTKREIDGALPDILVDHFELYIDQFRDLIRGARGHDALWPSRFGGALSTIGIHQIFKRHFAAILHVNAASHDCRRAAANLATLDTRAPANLAQAILQHRTSRTAYRYITARRQRTRKLLSRIIGC